MSLVSLQTVKQLGRIDTNIHDDLLNLLIASSEDYAFSYCEFEKATGNDIVSKVEGGQYLWLPSAPIYEVTSVSVDGVDIDPSLYDFDTTKIWLKSGECFLEGYKNHSVTYKAGYYTDPVAPIAGALEAPVVMRLAIAELALRSYNNPEGAKRISADGGSVEWSALNVDDDIHNSLRRISFAKLVS